MLERVDGLEERCVDGLELVGCDIDQRRFVGIRRGREECSDEDELQSASYPSHSDRCETQITAPG